MFYLDVMNKKVANFHKNVVPHAIQTVFYGTALYTLFVVRMKTTWPFDSKFQIKLFVSLTLGVRYKITHKKSEHAPLRRH